MQFIPRDVTGIYNVLYSYNKPQLDFQTEVEKYYVERNKLVYS